MGGVPVATGSGRRRWLILLVIGAVAAPGVWFLVRALRPSDMVSPSAPGPGAGEIAAGYVGRETCAGCHQAEAERWRGSDHDLAMDVANEQTVLGNFAGEGAKQKHYAVTSTFSKRGGRYQVETDGPDGKLHTYPIAYTFGVRPLQQYLIEFPSGRYQALSVSWDSRPTAEGGQRWFHLYPNESIPFDDELHWTGAQQNWNFMCAECHSTALEKHYDPAADRYATTWSEIDVSCEACHGPGSAHVDWAKAHAGAGAGAGSADPTKGLRVLLREATPVEWSFAPKSEIAHRSPPPAFRAEVETCARCHARRAVLSENYVHGRPILDTHRISLLDDPLYYDDGQIRGEVYEYGSFLQSKMYAAGVSCSDCHDPHSSRVEAGRDAVCSRCHLPQKFDTYGHHFHQPSSAGASCVACHMPATYAMVIDPRRDHSFRVPRPDLTRKLGAPNACNRCHDDKSVAWAEQAAARFWPDLASRPHYGVAMNAGRTDQAGADPLLGQVIDDPKAPGIVRATAFTLLPQPLSAAAVGRIGHGLEDSDPLVRMGAVQIAEGIDAHGRAALLPKLLRDPVRTVRIDAGFALAGEPEALLTADQKTELDRALDEYRAAQAAQAERPESWVNLGTLAARRGDLTAAQSAYETAIRRGPRFIPAYVNLADAYRAMGNEVECERVLRQALVQSPDEASVHYALGLVLSRTGHTGDAVAELARAAKEAPEVALYSYAYGVALHSTGAAGQAQAVLDRAHARHPGDPEILVALATMARDAGQQATALDYARRLVALRPEDEGARQLLASLESHPSTSSPAGEPR